MLAHALVTASLSALLILLAPLAASAQAQSIPGCTPRQLDNPVRTVFECAGGFTIQAETATHLGLVPPDGGTAAETLDIEGGAALLEVTPGGRTPQIRTPHAIASVRGTTYAVQVTGDKTSLFVVEGQVRVTRRDGGDEVTLGPRKGIEIEALPPSRKRGVDGDAPALVAQEWGQSRIDALLGRFGR